MATEAAAPAAPASAGSAPPGAGGTAAAAAAPALPATPSFQQAAAAARAEHSKPPEQAPTAAARTETVVPATPPTQHTDPAAGASPDTASTDLISDADLASILKLPVDEQRKALNTRWTQKTQALAAERKAAEHLTSYKDLIEGLERDPQGTLSTLAVAHGLKLAEAPTAPAAAASTATSIADAAVAQVKAALGPDYDFMAEPMAKAIHAVAESVAKAVAEQTVAPLKAITDSQQIATVKAQIDTATQQLTAKYPDWKTHEGEMVALMEKIQPGKGMGELEYSELLYREATREQSAKAVDVKIAEAVKAALAKASGGSTGEQAQAAVTGAGRVALKPGRPLSFQEAHQMAKRGERIET